MEPVVSVLLIASGMSAVAAFVAYWSGVRAAERRWRCRESDLLDDLDEAITVLSRTVERPDLAVVLPFSRGVS